MAGKVPVIELETAIGEHSLLSQHVERRCSRHNRTRTAGRRVRVLMLMRKL